MSTTIPINVNVPQGFNVNLLAERLAEYAKKLIADSNIATAQKKHYRHEALCGIFDDKATEEELVEEYLTEKYEL